MTPPLFDRPEIGVIRFTRRIAMQCSQAAARIPDWVVCDTIANGKRRRLGRRGTRGGILVRFEREFPGTDGTPGATLRVLAELTRDSCHALQVLGLEKVRRKIWEIRDF